MREYGHALDDESLRILLAEVECIINSRPLTVTSSDPGDLYPFNAESPIDDEIKDRNAAPG